MKSTAAGGGEGGGDVFDTALAEAGASLMLVASTDAHAVCSARWHCQKVSGTSGVIVSGVPVRLDEVRSRLRRKFMAQKDLVEPFVQAICARILGDETALHAALLPMTVGGGDAAGPPPQPERAQIGAQDSVLRLLLRVAPIQTRLLEALFQKLPELTMGGDDAAAGGGFGGGDAGGVADSDGGSGGGGGALYWSDVPRLLLSQVRWLEHIVAPAALCTQVLQVLQACCDDNARFTRELVAFVPEVVSDDATVGDAVDQLHELLATDSQTMLVPVLDAFEHMALAGAALHRATLYALALLEAAALDALPALVRFLMHSARTLVAAEAVASKRFGRAAAARGGGADDGEDADDDDADDETCSAQHIIDALRRKLHFAGGAAAADGGDEPPASQRPDGDDGAAAALGGRSGGDAALHERLTLEALLHGLQFSPPLASAFLATIERAGRATVADVWALLCLHTARPLRKRVELVVVRRAARGALPDALLHAALGGRRAALVVVFPALLALADALLRRRADAAAAALGRALYARAFVEFGEPSQRQELVGQLVAHAGSGVTHEVDAAFGVLRTLALSHARGAGSTALGQFDVFVKGLLDYIEGLSNDHVRALFEVLLALNDGGKRDEGSGDGSGGGVGGRDDVHIVIRKYVSHNELACKRVGIIGGVAFVIARATASSAAVGGAASARGAGRAHGGSLAAAAALAASQSVAPEDEETMLERDDDDDDDDAEGDGGSGGALDETSRVEIQQMLNTLRAHCRANARATAFLYDELTCALRLAQHGVSAGCGGLDGGFAFGGGGDGGAGGATPAAAGGDDAELDDLGVPARSRGRLLGEAVEMVGELISDDFTDDFFIDFEGSAEEDELGNGDADGADGDGAPGAMAGGAAAGAAGEPPLLHLQSQQPAVPLQFKAVDALHGVPLELQCVPRYNLDGPQSPFCLNVLKLEALASPALAAGFAARSAAGGDAGAGAASCRAAALLPLGPNPMLLCPMLRLMSACSADLGEIDAVLGCPILLPAEAALNQFARLRPVLQDVVARAHVHVLNWLRELTNVFVGAPVAEMRFKIVARLAQMDALRGALLFMLNSGHASLLDAVAAAAGYELTGGGARGRKATAATAAAAAAAALKGKNDEGEEKGEEEEEEDDADEGMDEEEEEEEEEEDDDDMSDDAGDTAGAKKPKGKGKAAAATKASTAAKGNGKTGKAAPPKGKGKAKPQPAKGGGMTEAERKEYHGTLLARMLRPLEPRVVLALSFPTLQARDYNSEGETEAVHAARDVALEPSVERLLVDELHAKLHAALRSVSPFGGGGFGGGGGGGPKVVHLAAAACCTATLPPPSGEALLATYLEV